MYCKRHLIFLLILALCATTARAQSKGSGPDSTELGAVVVTGQYAPGKAEKAVQRISIIDRKKIDAMAAQNLRDVMSNQMNVRLSQDNVLGSSLSLQGIGGQNVKILIDGIPVIGRQDGNIDLSQINLQNVERIEIVEGPMSVNYGTDALAGTINLISKKTPSASRETSFSGYAESIGTYNLNASFGIREGKHNLLLNAGRNFFDGWKPGEPFSLNFSARSADSDRVLLWLPREQYQAGGTYSYTSGNFTYGYRGSYFTEEITNRGMPGYKGQSAVDDYYYTRRLDNAVFVNGKLGTGGNLNLHLAYNDYRRVKNVYNNNLTNLVSTIVTDPAQQDTTRFKTFNSRGAYSTSLAEKKLNYELGYEVNIETGAGQRIRGREQQISDYALYGSAEYRPFSALTIRPGLRYAYNTSYNAPLIPSLNLRYQPVKDLVLRASYARGFRAPGLKELFFYFVDANHNILGNEDLRAEYSHNFNLSGVWGRQLTGWSWRTELAAFYNDIHDKIDLAQVAGGGPTDYTYVNISRYKSMGLQLNLSLTVKDISAGLGAGYTGRYNDLSADQIGVAAFSYSPELRGNLSYLFRPAGITASLFTKYTGSLPGYGVDAAGSVYTTRIEGYTIADLTLSRPFAKKHLVLGLGCKNIFDVQTVAVTGTGGFLTGVNGTGGAHSNSSTSRSVSTGRTYFLKLDVNLKQD